MNRPTRPFSGHRIGVELEIEANSRILRDEIVNRTTNWFTREHDSSLGSFGIELITIPLLPDDAKSYATWQPLCDYLKSRAVSWITVFSVSGNFLQTHGGGIILSDDESLKRGGFGLPQSLTN